MNNYNFAPGSEKLFRAFLLAILILPKLSNINNFSPQRLLRLFVSHEALIKLFLYSESYWNIYSRVEFTSNVPTAMQHMWLQRGNVLTWIDF